MAWQHFTTPVESGDPVTTDMIDELVDAFHERLLAACDTGAGVDYAEYNRELLSLGHIPYDRRNRHTDPKPFKEHLALAIIRLSAARKGVFDAVFFNAEDDHYGYLYHDSVDDEWKFFQYANNDGNILVQAAQALGYAPSMLLEFWTPRSDDYAFDDYVGEWDDHGGLRTAFVFNVCRKAIQLLQYPIVPVYASTTLWRDTNEVNMVLSGFDTRFGKGVNNEDPPWSSVVDTFHATTPTVSGLDSAMMPRLSASYDPGNDEYQVNALWERNVWHLDSVSYGDGFRPLCPFARTVPGTADYFRANVASSVNGGPLTAGKLAPPTDDDPFWFWMSPEETTDLTAAEGVAAYTEAVFLEYTEESFPDPAGGGVRCQLGHRTPNSLIAGRWPSEEWGAPSPIAFYSAEVDFELGDDA